MVDEIRGVNIFLPFHEMGVNLILVFKKSVCDVILRNRSVYFAGIFIEQTVFVMDGLNLAEVDFLYVSNTTEDIALSQACEYIENEHFAFELLENNEENATLSQCYDAFERTGFSDLEDTSLSQLMRDYDTDISGTFEMDIDDLVGDHARDDLRPEINNETGRFADPVTDQYIKELIDNQENKNTKKNTNWSIRVFEKWRLYRNAGVNANNPVPELKTMNAGEVNFFLGRFVLEARKQDGSEYPTHSLYYIICGLLRNLRDNGVHDKNFLDVNDHRFTEFRKILDCKMKDLLSRGFGTKIN